MEYAILFNIKLIALVLAGIIKENVYYNVLKEHSAFNRKVMMEIL